MHAGQHFQHAIAAIDHLVETLDADPARMHSETATLYRAIGHFMQAVQKDLSEIKASTASLHR